MPAPEPRQGGRRPRLNAFVVGALALALAFMVAVQVRSQAEVERSLASQDNTSLAFLIDDLHRANDQLASEQAALQARTDELRTGGGTGADAQLTEELRKLQVVEGLVPVHGPGVVVTVDAPLGLLDLEDALNNLRAAGAEALDVNGRRVVTGSALRSAPGGVSLDGVTVQGPWTLTAIGDESQLGSVAEVMTRSLRADPRVRAAGYRVASDLQVRSTVAPRPFLYGS